MAICHMGLLFHVIELDLGLGIESFVAAVVAVVVVVAVVAVVAVV